MLLGGHEDFLQGLFLSGLRISILIALIWFSAWAVSRIARHGQRGSADTARREDGWDRDGLAGKRDAREADSRPRSSKQA